MENASDRRQRDALVVALQQYSTDFLLQLSNGDAQWWLGDEQFPGGVSEMQFFCDGDEVAKLA